MAIAKYFDKCGIPYTQEKTFKECVNSRGNYLRYDFYLEQYNLLIEYQGPHHEKPINKYRRARIAHEKTVIHDVIKANFAEQQQINLLKIDWKDFNKLAVILDQLIKDIKKYFE